jgi:hypothetical protein
MITALVLIVYLVDGRWLRAALSLAPALVLAYRPFRAGTGEEGRLEEEGMERRRDLDMRGAVDELLRHIREFYLTCHLMATGKLSPDDAVEKAAQQELELNRLFARVTDQAKRSRVEG